MSTDVDNRIDWVRLHEALAETLAGLPRAAVIRIDVQNGSGAQGFIEVGADERSDGIGVRACADAVPMEWDLVSTLVADALISRGWLPPAVLPGRSWMWISPVGVDRATSASLAASRAVTMLLLMTAARGAMLVSIRSASVQVEGAWHVLPSAFVESLAEVLPTTSP